MRPLAVKGDASTACPSLGSSVRAVTSRVAVSGKNNDGGCRPARSGIGGSAVSDRSFGGRCGRRLLCARVDKWSTTCPSRVVARRAVTSRVADNDSGNDGGCRPARSGIGSIFRDGDAGSAGLYRAFKRVRERGRVFTGDSGDRGVRVLDVLPAHLAERVHNRVHFLYTTAGVPVRKELVGLRFVNFLPVFFVDGWSHCCCGASITSTALCWRTPSCVVRRRKVGIAATAAAPAVARAAAPASAAAAAAATAAANLTYNLGRSNELFGACVAGDVARCGDVARRGD